jgi:hypothetical protein
MIGTKDRRYQERFSIQRDLSYRVLNPKGSTISSGEGKTTNMSSRGVLIVVREKMPQSGDRVELNVSWPARSDDSKLQLIVKGRVVRVVPATHSCAVEILQYEFKTATCQPAA